MIKGRRVGISGLLRAAHLGDRHRVNLLNLNFGEINLAHSLREGLARRNYVLDKPFRSRLSAYCPLDSIRIMVLFSTSPLYLSLVAVVVYAPLHRAKERKLGKKKLG